MSGWRVLARLFEALDRAAYAFAGKMADLALTCRNRELEVLPFSEEAS